MKILFFSRSWPSNEHSGVAFSAFSHVQILLKDSHNIGIVGSYENIYNENLDVKLKFYVRSFGTGALYSPSRVDKKTLLNLINDFQPNLIIVESWQTALTDTAIDIGYSLGIPILMVSHGISVDPFDKSIIEYIRSFGWIFYKYIILPSRVKKLSAITTLDLLSNSKRFYDRDIAIKYKIPVIALKNLAVNTKKSNIPVYRRLKKILCIGYFSRVKNQLDAIRIIENIHPDFKLHLIGDENNSYYTKCKKYVKKHKLETRVIFSSDKKCCIGDEIASSYLVLSTSITEVLPVVLLEAMSSGTPFVARPVGAVSSLKGGVIASSLKDQIFAINDLINNHDKWNNLSKLGELEIREKYTNLNVENSLYRAIESAINK